MSFVQLQVSLCSSQFIVPFSLQKQSETYICYTNKYKARLMDDVCTAANLTTATYIKRFMTSNCIKVHFS
jgi:hypothetical protein